MYKLKPDQPDFQTVDGSMPLMTFRTGETYGTIPPEEAHRFEAAGTPQEEPAATRQEETGGYQ